MKKLLIATVFSLSLISSINAHWHHGCKQEATCCQTETVCCETQVPPICTKTVMENKIIKVPKTVRVPALKILVPQPDIIERIPQAPRKICIKQPPIPQPDIIKYECVPDKIVCKKQPPLVRYECPAGTNENNGCHTAATECCR